MKKNIFIAAFMVFIMNTLYAGTLLENPFPAHPKANDGYINHLNTHTKSRMEQPALQSTDCDTIILKDGSVLAVEIRRSKRPSVIRFSKCGATDGATSVLEISNVLEIKSTKYSLSKNRKIARKKEAPLYTKVKKKKV